MPHRGWVKLWRKVEDSAVWNSREPFDRRSAWVDLLLRANHESREVLHNGKVYTIRRGQIATSEPALARRWRWSRGKVRRFFSVLLAEQMIEQDTGQGFSFITLLNYEAYNDPGSEAIQGSVQRLGQQSVQQSDRQRYTLEEGKNSEGKSEEEPLFPPEGVGVPTAKKAKKRPTYSPEFESFWSAYPRRPSNPKRASYPKWEGLIRTGEATPEELIEAARRYAAEKRNETDRSKILMAVTFLGPQARWEPYARPEENAPAGGGARTADQIWNSNGRTGDDARFWTWLNRALRGEEAPGDVDAARDAYVDVYGNPLEGERLAAVRAFLAEDST